MSELLIHSMAMFGEIIFDALNIADARTIVEIGTEAGGTSRMLADRTARVGGSLTCIDPAPRQEFTDWLAQTPGVAFIPGTSLDAIPNLSNVDAWLIDGDHNWYTVYHELTAIDRLTRRDGRALFVLLHDVGWPCARRDTYYMPDRIPAEFRQPFDYDSGMVPGHAGLLPGRGFRGMGSFAAAKAEGGPRNGVLTAVEDFLEEQLDAGRELGFAEIPGVFGLGVVFDLDAAWSGAMADLLAPFHCNSLLTALENNRLANYLRVLDYQDAASG